MLNCWDLWGNVIHGSKGSALLGEGVSAAADLPRLEASPRERRLAVEREAGPAYQREHDLLFDAIRQDRPYNETQRCAWRP